MKEGSNPVVCKSLRQFNYVGLEMGFFCLAKSCPLKRFLIVTGKQELMYHRSSGLSYYSSFLFFFDRLIER